jgi:hypothetical protein
MATSSSDIYNTVYAGLEKLALLNKYSIIDNPNSLVSVSTEAFNKMRIVRLDLMDFSNPKDGVLIMSHTFRGTPEDLKISVPSRTTVTQTRGGYWIDDFGVGVRELSIKGVTGYKKLPVQGNGNKKMDGRQLIDELSDIYNQYNKRRKALYEDNKDFRQIKLIIHLFMDGLHLVVHPTNFSISRSKASPLMYSYDISFIVITEYQNDFRVITDSLADAFNISELHLPSVLSDVTADFMTLLNLSSNPIFNDDLGKQVLGVTAAFGGYLSSVIGDPTQGITDTYNTTAKWVSDGGLFQYFTTFEKQIPKTTGDTLLDGISETIGTAKETLQIAEPSNENADIVESLKSLQINVNKVKLSSTTSDNSGTYETKVQVAKNNTSKKVVKPFVKKFSSPQASALMGSIPKKVK